MRWSAATIRYRDAARQRHHRDGVIPARNSFAGDWGDTIELPGIRLRFTPAHHWSARGIADRRMALWAAFVLDSPGGPIYHIGDTGFHDGINFEAAGREPRTVPPRDTSRRRL